MNRQQLQQLSELRLREAQASFAAGLPDGAYYLAGYAVECALKACIANRTHAHDFPDKKLATESHTHNLIDLMRVAQLESDLKLARKSDSRLEDDWITLQNWSETSRYKRWKSWEAQSLLEAVETGSGGLLPWIRLHW
jgi:hypothetical protein